MFRLFLIALTLLAPGCHTLTLRRAAHEWGKSDLCMLAPTYEPDFVFMAARLKLQSHFQKGEVPTTVVVFDTPEAYEAFCSTYSDVCNESFFPLALSTILGPKYDEVKVSVAKSKSHTNLTRGPCALVGEPMSNGRTYQSIKKFYGVIHGPEHCKSYWVSDSESLPFRPYDFNKVFKPMSHSQLVSSWYPDKDQCTYRHNDWRDPECSAKVADLLKLDQSWNTNGPTEFMNQYHHQNYPVDQIWTYDRGLVDKMIYHVEHDTGSDFATQFKSWGWSDAAFYQLMAMYYAAFPGHTQAIKNLPDEIKRKFPEAHESCCSCARGSDKPGCMTTMDLFSECMMQKQTPEQLASFLVEDLGVFAHWFEWGDIPNSVLNAHKDFSWCVNNCFNNNFLGKLNTIEGVNTEELLKDPVVAEAFARDKTGR